MPPFVAVNDDISPVPFAARPIEGVLFTQLYTVPGTDPEKVMAAVEVLLHTTWLETAFTVAVGFTVIVKVFEEPVQVVPALV